MDGPSLRVFRALGDFEGFAEFEDFVRPKSPLCHVKTSHFSCNRHHKKHQRIGKHEVSNKFKNCLRTILGFHNWEIYRKFYVFNRFLTSSPDWELWYFLQ